MSIIGLNSKTDPNKILPMTYKWAREHYKDGVANNWTPEEISMQKDVEQWKSDKAISDVERRMILWNLGFFSTAESLTANNIVLTVYKHVTNPESRQYLLRQACLKRYCLDSGFVTCL
jgi:ribonucleoside-diphosphate reductase beta chain